MVTVTRHKLLTGDTCVVRLVTCLLKKSSPAENFLEERTEGELTLWGKGMNCYSRGKSPPFIL